MRTSWHALRKPIGKWIDRVRFSRLGEPARSQWQKDSAGLPAVDPGSTAVIEACLGWIARAQDCSTSHDGGVAHSFSLLDGWNASYPETTGYIVPTLLSSAAKDGRDIYRARARRMLDWLVSIQLPSGAFQAGRIDSTPVMPAVFNTGQILLGLASGVREFGPPYLDALRRAAHWLAAMQDADGCWRRGASPFAPSGERPYDVHVGWGLLEAARVDRQPAFADAALANARWALGVEEHDGWFRGCSMSPTSELALTHVLGYVLRGLVEAYRYAHDGCFLEAALRTAMPLVRVVDEDGFLPGVLRRGFKPAASWTCLTGTAQIASCWLDLFRLVDDPELREAAFRANRFVRRSIAIDGDPDTRGAVKGSFPVSGFYSPFRFPNWAAKFVVDANLLELEVRGSIPCAVSSAS